MIFVDGQEIKVIDEKAEVSCRRQMVQLAERNFRYSPG
jgi:hypothetical protein